MSGWAIPNAVRTANANEQARRFAEYIDASDTLKEAAWLARLPDRTARRYARKVDR